MKNKYCHIVLIFVILYIPILTVAQSSTPLIKKGVHYKNEKQFQRWQYFNNQRQKYTPEKITDIYSMIQSHKYNEQLQGNLVWEQLGPIKKDSLSDKEYDGNGRINSIAFDPTDPRIIYVGAATGGIWKTTDRGQSWKILDMTGFMSIGISDIEVARFQPNTIYAATGDAETLFAGSYSIGIIKSTDAGNTWGIISDKITLADSVIISEMVIDPIDPDFLTVATSQGIIRTSDGGHTWDKIYGDSTTFIRDIELQPSNPYTIYASSFDWEGNTEIIISKDDGESWQTLKKYEGICRIEMAVTQDNPNSLYVLTSKNNSFKTGELACYHELTNQWEELNYKPSPDVELVFNQGFYNLLLEVNPEDENEIYAGGVKLFHTTNRGVTWEEVNNIHVDHHDFKFAADGYRYSANDGGIYCLEKDKSEWKSINDGLNITQFYKLCLNPRNDMICYGGSQDNGMKIFINHYWEQLHSADGMEICVDPVDNSIVYTSIQRGDIYLSNNFGYQPHKYISSYLSQFDAPWLTEMTTHPHRTQELFVAYRNLFYTSDKGESWVVLTDLPKKEGFISALYIDEDAIYFGNTDVVYVLQDKKVAKIAEVNFPVSDIIKIEDAVYFSQSGFDEQEKIFKYELGEITNITNNFPNIPVNCLCYLKDQKMLIAGSDIGVLEYHDDVKQWTFLGTGLPNVIVNDIAYNDFTNTIYVATFGCGMWKLDFGADSIIAPILNLTGEQTICEDEQDELKVMNYDSSLVYYWQDGSMGDTYSVSKSGIYYISCYDSVANVMSSSKIVSIEQKETPRVKMYLESDNVICDGESCSLRCEISNFQLNQCKLRWSNGDTTSHVSVFVAGLYYVTATNEAGCIGYSDSILVIVNEMPEKPLITKEGNFLVSSPEQRYQWYFENEPIDEAIGRKFYAKEKGQYFVKVTDEHRCSNTSDIYILDVSVDEIQVTPNPTTGIITIEGYAQETSVVEFKVFDLQGRLCVAKREGNIQGFFSRKIDLGNMATGTYYVNVKIGVKEFSRKIEIY